MKIDTWTEDRIAILIEEHGKGTARRAIADILNERTGATFTKSAVCGKIDRLFPAARPVKTAEERAATEARRRERDRLKKQRKRAAAGARPRVKRTDQPRHKYAVRLVSANGNSNAMRVIRSVVTGLPPLRCVDIEPLNLTTYEINLGKQCEFIKGHDGLHCGHPTQAGSSYCTPHHDLCWEPPRPKVDRRFRGVAA